jgi:hypothetical protein
VVGEVVDCADERGEGELEDDLEDCFGVEACLPHLQVLRHHRLPPISASDDRRR